MLLKNLCKSQNPHFLVFGVCHEDHDEVFGFWFFDHEGVVLMMKMVMMLLLLLLWWE